MYSSYIRKLTVVTFPLSEGERVVVAINLITTTREGLNIMSCADGGNFLCKKSQFMLAGWGPRPYELKLSLRGAEKLDENCKAGKKKQRRSNPIKLNGIATAYFQKP